MTDRTSKWTQDDVRLLRLEQLNERLRRYRLAQPKLEKNMLQSLERYGQISPIVVCLHEDEYVLIDGFKRLTAARTLKGMTSLKAQRMDVDEQGAKAAIYNLNCIVASSSGVRRVLDRAGVSSRRRTVAGGSSSTVGPPQELGQPSTCDARASLRSGSRGTSPGVADGERWPAN